MKNVKMIHGIDTLYYYCETNQNYDELFLEILDQIEEKKGIFDKKDIEYQNSDINISINTTPLNFLGKSDGFYWFRDINEFFKIGFKDYTKQRNMNDIRVQLQGIGIYTVGINSLIEFINKELLKEYVTDYCPITRADLNCFIQYDFSFISKEMFSTRKQKYSMISEIGSSTTTQTLYVGKDPFKLRLYNKKEELKKSSKRDLMNEYFLNHGFDLEDEIFNVEFEMKREHLKQFNVLTVDDMLSNAVKLFQSAMNDIRLIDNSNITEKDIKNNSKSRAVTLPIWEHIKESYSLGEFLQTALPLERIKRKISIYDDMKFRLEIIAVLRRAFINNLVVELEHLDAYYFEAKKSLKKTTTNKQMKKIYEDLPNYINEDGKQQRARILEDNTIIKPVNVVSVNTLSDYDLTMYLNKLTKNKDISKHDYNLYSVAFSEAKKRSL
jgi:hypothetical protein